MARKKRKEIIDDGYEVQLINRIAECETVVEHLENCTAFKVVAEDCKREINIIDSKWHTLPDNKEYLHQIQELRLTKMAYEHLINLGEKYKDELKQLKDDLYKMQNRETVITKDFDTD